MALAQRSRVKLSTRAKTETKQKQGTFSALFPEQGIKDATLSAHCMKKLLVVGVSSIAYLRNMFPNSAFGDRAIEDMSLKILRERSQSPEACQVVAWLKNIFPAIENRYVNKVVVGVYDGAANPDALMQDDLIETHTFKFGSINHSDYIKITTSQNQTLKLPTSADFKANSINLLRTLLMTTQALDKLPEVCLLALKVYYDDSVPEDFTLDGFEEVTQRSERDPFSVPRDSRVKIEVGGTATHHDALKVYVQTNQNRFETTDDQVPQAASRHQEEAEVEAEEKEEDEQGNNTSHQQEGQEEEQEEEEEEKKKKKGGTHAGVKALKSGRARKRAKTKKQGKDSASNEADSSAPPRTRSRTLTRSSKNKRQQKDSDPFGFEAQDAQQQQEGGAGRASTKPKEATVAGSMSVPDNTRKSFLSSTPVARGRTTRSSTAKRSAHDDARGPDVEKEQEEDGEACTPPSKKANLLLLKKTARATTPRRGLNAGNRIKQQKQRDKGGQGSEETVMRATAQDAAQFDAYEFCDSQDETAIQKKGGKQRGKRRSTVVKRPVRLTTRSRSRK